MVAKNVSQALPACAHGAISMGKLRYLLLHVVEGVGGVDGEADEDYVGVWVGERTETVVILLASRIPKSQLDVLSIDLNIGNIVLEDGWDVDLLSHIISLAWYSCIWQVMLLCI